MRDNPAIIPMAVAPVPRLSLRENEAAEALGVSPSWLRREAAEGRIPSVKIAGKRLYPVDVLRTWLAEEAEGETS